MHKETTAIHVIPLFSAVHMTAEYAHIVADSTLCLLDARKRCLRKQPTGTL